MRAVWAAALLLRRLRADAGVLFLLFVVIAATSFVFAAAPRLFNRAADSAVRYAATTASPVQRDVWLYTSGFIGPGSQSPLAGMREYGTLREADFPAPVEQLFTGRSLSFTAARLAVQDSLVHLSLRYQDGVTDDARLVAGRWPADRGMPLAQIHPGDLPNGGQTPPAVFEAALSTAMAQALGANVGDRLHVGLDLSDPLLPSAGGIATGGSGAVGTGKRAFGIAPTDIEVVGVYEPRDPGAAEWSGSGLLQPVFRYGRSGIEAIYAAAFVASDAYPSLYAALLPFHYDWHFQVGPDRLDAGQVDALQLALQRLTLIASTPDHRYLSDVKSSVNLAEISVGTGLPGILDTFAAQLARSESVLSIAALGPLGLAAGATAMLAVLLARRRRDSLLLARGRGASGALLLGAQLWEAVLLAGSASLVGLLLAVAAVSARDSSLSPMLVGGVAAVSVFLLVAATWPAARRPLMQLERDDPTVLRVPARRLVAEGAIAVAAVVTVFLLRQRGLTLGSADDVVRFDPLLATVPLLSGLAAGIVAMRLYPLPVRVLGWLAAHRRDLVPVVGLRTVARHPAAANLPLLVLMLSAAFGAFAAVVESTIDRGQLAASYLSVGADYRLEAYGPTPLPASLDPATIPGVAAVATASVDPAAIVVQHSYQRSTVEIDAVDASAYASVTAGTPADPGWPSTFFVPPAGTDIGSDAKPIPVIVSPDFLKGVASLDVGDTFTATVAQQPLTFRLVQRAVPAPGLGAAASSAMVPLEWLRAALPDVPLEPTVMWVRGPSAVAQPLAAMLGDPSNQIRLISRDSAYALLHDAPLGSAVADGFGLALGTALLFLAITLVGAVVMSAAGRTRDLGYLRTLGISTRQALGLTAVEHAPPALLAVIPGLLLGIAVAIVVEPGLGLSEFVGGWATTLSVDWLSLGLVVAALAAIVCVAIGVGTWLAGRARLANVLRIEDS